MDILITYRHTFGNDLKYCIRAIEKHAKGIDNIYVVGDKPLNADAKHIPCSHYNYIDNKLASTWQKVYEASKLKELSDDFVLFSDDYFLTKDVDFTTYKNKVRKYDLDRDAEGKKISLVESNGYIKVRLLTANYLRARGYTFKNYDLHCPMILNKKKVIELSERFPWKRKLISGFAPYALKSVYGNYFKEPCEVFSDNKILLHPEFTIENPKLKKGFVFSTGNFIHTPEVVSVFEDLYPKEEAPKPKKVYTRKKEKKEYD